jgi:multidrug resistance efflux pump
MTEQPQFLHLKNNHIKKGQKLFTIDVRYSTITEAETEEDFVFVNDKPVTVIKVKLEPYMAYVSAINKKVALSKFTKSIKKELEKQQSINTF